MRKIIVRYGWALLLTMILAGAFALRVHSLHTKVGDPHLPNFGGDPCHHYNLAHNVAAGNGPVTDFIYRFWFRHPAVPALTDAYPPGYYLILGAGLRIFGDTYYNARLICLAFAMLNILIVFLTGTWLHSRAAGLVAAALFAFNTFHIENSVVTMSPVGYSLSLSAALLGILIALDRGAIWKFIAGALNGFAMLTVAGAQGLSVALVAFLCLKQDGKRRTRRDLLKWTLFYGVGCALILAPWAYMTWRYFGKPFYTARAFEPIANMSESLSSEQVPLWSEFLKTHPLGPLLYQYGTWAGPIAKELAELLCPSIGGKISVLLFYPLVIWGLLRSKKKAGWIFFISFALFFTAMLLGSRVTDGLLWPRHYILFLPFLAPLYGVGLADGLQRLFARIHAQSWTPVLALLLAAWGLSRWYGQSWDSVNSGGSLWTRSSPSFVELGKWIDTHLPKDAILMQFNTPQDLWCVSGRRVVQDPSYWGSADYRARRAREEVAHYHVNYLLVNRNDDIYTRSTLIRPEDISTHYAGLELEPVFTDPKNGYYLYYIKSVKN